MASLSSDGPNGRYRVTFDRAGKRHTLRLGKVSKKAAEAVKLRVEHLLAARAAGVPLDPDTAGWVAGLGDALHAKLAGLGLVPERRTESLGGFLAGLIAERRAAGAKPTTLDNLQTPANALLAHLKPDTPLRTVTPAAAAGFLAAQQARLGRGTVARQLRTVRLFFRTAVTRGLIPADPFAALASPGGLDRGRQRYVTVADAERLLAAAGPGWRTAVALMRFAGLRCPTEVAGLRWADVDLAGGRMTVSSPKTEHLPDRAYRVVPVFEALRPHLEEAWELAEPGAEFVVPWPALRAKAAASPRGWKGVSLGTRFARLVRRAGLPPLPKPAVNLRGSCETDLMHEHPGHVVTAWIGNSERVARNHYLTVREEDFARAAGTGAARNPARTGADPNRLEPSGATIQRGNDLPVPSGLLRGIPVLAAKYARPESNRD